MSAVPSPPIILPTNNTQFPTFQLGSSQILAQEPRVSMNPLSHGICQFFKGYVLGGFGGREWGFGGREWGWQIGPSLKIQKQTYKFWIQENCIKSLHSL